MSELMDENLSHDVAAPRVLEWTTIEEEALTPPKGVTNLLGEYLDEQGTVIHSSGLPTWCRQVFLVCRGIGDYGKDFREEKNTQKP